jgi:hypothetical protein
MANDSWLAVSSARERLRNAERDLEDAKHQFHRAVYQLSREGNSLRAIAGKLEMSFQRIYQIVADCRKPPGSACSFCGAPPAGRAMIAGPGVRCCSECLNKAREAFERTEPVGDFEVSNRSTKRCTFCTRRRQVVGNGDASICAECILLANGALDRSAT